MFEGAWLDELQSDCLSSSQRYRSMISNRIPSAVDDVYLHFCQAVRFILPLLFAVGWAWAMMMKIKYQKHRVELFSLLNRSSDDCASFNENPSSRVESQVHMERWKQKKKPFPPFARSSVGSGEEKKAFRRKMEICEWKIDFLLSPFFSSFCRAKKIFTQNRFSVIGKDVVITRRSLLIISTNISEGKGIKEKSNCCFRKWYGALSEAENWRKIVLWTVKSEIFGWNFHEIPFFSGWRKRNRRPTVAL